MFDHELVESLVIPICNQLVGLFLVERSRFFNEVQKSAPAIDEVIGPMLDLGGAEGVDVEADVFTAAAVSGSFEHAHLIKGASEIGAAKGLVLIELQSVLIIEVERPQFPERHGEIDFVRGIQTSQDAMGGFDQSADSFWIVGQLSDGQRVTDGGKVGVIHRFVRFRFDCQAGSLVVSQHAIESVDQQFDAAPAVFGFPQIGPLASQPEDDEIGAENSGDINATERPVDGVLPAFFVVAGVSAINGHRTEPESGCDHFCGDSLAVQAFLQLFCFFADLSIRFVVEVRDGIVVVEHHGVEPELFQLGQFPIERLGRPGSGPVRIGAFANIPRTKTEPVSFIRHN